MNYETRISTNRTKLEEVIPLDAPYVLYIDPCDTCNFQCKFCPTGNRKLMSTIPGRLHGPMKVEDYYRIIDSLHEFKSSIKVLRLYKDGEPLLNKSFEDMVLYAKRSGKIETIDTTTNASLLTEKRSEAIISSGLGRINISIEGMSTEEYGTFSRCHVDFNRMVENISYFYSIRGSCHVFIKMNEDITTEDSKKRFLDTFGPISDGISTEHVMSCWPLFEQKEVLVNSTMGIYGQPINKVMVCPYVFYSISINSDMSVSACFLDWQRVLLVGDTRVMSIANIWSGDRMNQLRVMFLEGNRLEDPVCKSCGQLTHGCPDNIDEWAKEILGRIVNGK